MLCQYVTVTSVRVYINVAFVGVDGIFHRRDTSLRKAVICVLIFLLLNFTTLHLCCYNF